jgi:hypothetical protein
LHDFAQVLGLERRWFQNKPSGQHYDLSKNKRDQAIQLGALPVTAKEMLLKCSLRLRNMRDKKRQHEREV